MKKHETRTFTTGPEEFILITGPDTDIQIGPQRSVDWSTPVKGEFLVRYMRTGGVETKTETIKVK